MEPTTMQCIRAVATMLAGDAMVAARLSNSSIRYAGGDTSVSQALFNRYSRLYDFLQSDYEHRYGRSVFDEDSTVFLALPSSKTDRGMERIHP
jgi:hypothetical protein